MKRLTRRILLSLAALSPGVAAVTIQEFAFTLALMVLGLTGAISLAVAVTAVSPKITNQLFAEDTAPTAYPSLLRPGALSTASEHFPDPLRIKAHFLEKNLVEQIKGGFVTREAHLHMVLAQIMARWGESDASRLSDDQLRELWLVERLLRASPAEAGALSGYFAAPEPMLAMRDRVATAA